MQSDTFLKSSIANFLTSWYGLSMVQAGKRADIVVVNEADFDTVKKLSAPPPNSRRGPIVLALCSHSTRFDRANAISSHNHSVGFLVKPIGPIKMARALSSCLDGIPMSQTPGLPSGGSNAAGNSPGHSDLSNVFEELTLSPHGGEMLDNSRMAAGSLNARKALESPTPLSVAERSKEFPFPVDDRPKLPRNWSLPNDKETLSTMPQVPTTTSEKRASEIMADMEKQASAPVASKKSSDQPVTLPSPRLLLVDDNKINLRLLRTYMRKRAFDKNIDEAENGLEAVQSFEKRLDGYDIIFMDISMPVLDGFGATRQIRQLEGKRREKQIEAGRKPDTPALVIALTGLASSRDQSEAFRSGVDLFLTKPVAFKEVGKMLDNWQANRERD